ncbi:MAG: hypothetical protein ABI561_18615 [Bradyrhizobium sp.]
MATAALIRWSIQDVLRIAIGLARIRPAHIIVWSLWRRAYQALAQRAHLKAKRHLYCEGGQYCQPDDSLAQARR